MGAYPPSWTAAGEVEPVPHRNARNRRVPAACDRCEIEVIRGVSAEAGITKLLEREMIYVVGRADLPGRPIQYGPRITSTSSSA